MSLVFAAKCTIPIAAPPDAAAPGVGFLYARYDVAIFLVNYLLNEEACKMAGLSFVKRGEKIAGPFTFEQIQKMVANKNFTKGDLMSTDKKGPWIDYLESIEMLEFDSLVGDSERQKNKTVASTIPATSVNTGPSTVQWENHLSQRPDCPSGHRTVRRWDPRLGSRATEMQSPTLLVCQHEGRIVTVG